jgi:hypothetical protein
MRHLEAGLENKVLLIDAIPINLRFRMDRTISTAFPAQGLGRSVTAFRQARLCAC